LKALVDDENDQDDEELLKPPEEGGMTLEDDVESMLSSHLN
jgi:hypothetical protein